MDRLRDLIEIGTIQRLGREAEQLSQRVEQTPIFMSLQLSLRVEQTILKDLELGRKLEQVQILKDLGRVLMDLIRIRRMV